MRGRIEQFVLAGAFGSYIDVASAIAVGLLPALPRRAVPAGRQRRRRRRRADPRLEARSARPRGRSRGDAPMSSSATRAEFQKRFVKNIGFPSRRKG